MFIRLVYFYESIRTLDLWFKVIAYNNNNVQQTELLKTELADTARDPPSLLTANTSAEFPIVQEDFDFVGYFIFGKAISWKIKLFPPLGILYIKQFGMMESGLQIYQ